MREYTLDATTRLPLARKEVFAFFADAANLALITPPELGFRIDSPRPVAMCVGALIDYTIRLYGIPIRWRTEITQWDPPHEFADTQLRGPYALWVHTHRFTEDAGGTVIHDRVRYALPFGILGRFAHPLVRRQLERIFSYRETAVSRTLLRVEAPAMQDSSVTKQGAGRAATSAVASQPSTEE